MQVIRRRLAALAENSDRPTAFPVRNARTVRMDYTWAERGCKEVCCKRRLYDRAQSQFFAKMLKTRGGILIIVAKTRWILNAATLAHLVVLRSRSPRPKVAHE